MIPNITLLAVLPRSYWYEDAYAGVVRAVGAAVRSDLGRDLDLPTVYVELDDEKQALSVYMVGDPHPEEGLHCATSSPTCASP